MFVWILAAFMLGGTLGVLTMALAAASKRVEELEAQLWDQYDDELDDDGSEPGLSRVLFLLTTHEGLSDQTLADVAQSIAQQTNGRVLILEPNDDEAEELD